MADTDTSLIRRLRELDQSRPSFLGEHWLAFALGLYLVLHKRPTALGRIASVLTGATLVARALSGRDGAIAMLRRAEQQHAAGGSVIDMAEPSPYGDQVRIHPGSRSTTPH